MPLGFGWSVAGLLGIGFLDLDAMVRTHGVLNAFAVVTAVATWTREPSALPARVALRVDPAGGRGPAAEPPLPHGAPKRAGSSSAGIDGARPRTRSATSRAEAGPVEIPHGP
jgi:hypothetical protein